ncbi:MAG: DUF362 domain-containing protein [Methanomicrobiales archaeon]|nr:DUF362 domain-containing protein [Methanomicrobiales archaeon]
MAGREKEVVSCVACGSYNREEVETAVRKAIDALGGITTFISPGSRVLLKPNLLQGLPPERCVTTHPEVVRAVSLICRDLGCRVIIADSPGGGIRYTPANLRRLYAAAGYEAVARDTGAELNYDTGYRTVSHPAGLLAKSFPVIAPALDADHIIVVSKAKTHLWTLYSGGAKNLFGVLPGLEKPLHHARFQDPDHFAGMILDLNDLLRPSLQVMDAVMVMEGDGPSSGTPRLVEALLAGGSATALDQVACKMMGIPAADVPTLRTARERGLPGSIPDQISLVGNPPKALQGQGVRLPSTYQGSGRGMQRSMLLSLLHRLGGVYTPYPSFQPDHCQHCGRCARICPVGALTLHEGVPELMRENCIRCYCCHEICPAGSIVIRPGPVRRLIAKISGLS